MRIHHGVSRMAAFVAVSMLLICAGCGSPTNKTAGASGDGQHAGTVAACKAPDFQGPYASEFKHAYEQSTTQLAKRILEDCQITDAELNEIYDAQNECLAPYGLVATKGQLSPVRASGLTSEEMNQKNTECAAKTDLFNVESIYDALQDNPNNLDAEAWQRKTYACLQQHDLLPKPISEEDYLALKVTNAEGLSDDQILEQTRKWNESFHVYMEYNDDGSRNPDYDSSKAQQFWQCQTDPLN